jgi:hypothetical protein
MNRLQLIQPARDPVQLILWVAWWFVNSYLVEKHSARSHNNFLLLSFNLQVAKRL